MKVGDLAHDEHAPWHKDYFNLIDESWSLVEEMEVSLHNFIRFVQDIPMDKYDYRYTEGKWTIKEIIQHVIDAERIFAYRALRFSRNDKTLLPGFDENAYAVANHANERHLQSLLNELSMVRHSNIALFKSFTPEDFLKRGTASGYVISVRALGFLIIGHQNHHIKVFNDRYL
ncbi:DinB family protein [Flavobacterium rhizosphaerae]|uniref:DinB family protein n=1 Tax=Flavobacterium rhizosphaerae TaxID=3163298 RepID=A0ABW8YXF8_9FLAO